jgi:hypothetical protein
MAESMARQLLALVEAPDHVCYRYRLRAFAPRLAMEGWKVRPVPFARGLLGLVRQLPRVAAAEVVVLQRRLLSRWQLWLLRRAAKVLVYDFDDAVFLRDSNTVRPTLSASRLTRFEATVRVADAVLAGNHFLTQQTCAWTDPERVHCIPTCIEPELYPLAAHARRGSQVSLAWIGSHSTVSSLHLAQPQLSAAARRLPGLRLKIICDRFPQLSHVEVVPRVWSSETEARELAEADVGISWLPDHPWSFGKCGLKVLQYMAAGLPVVANPRGIHEQLIEHGRTGFLASTPEQWAEAIHRLASSPALRLRMGHAARQRVERDFNLGGWAERLVTLLDRWVPRSGSQCIRPPRAAGPRPLPPDRELEPVYSHGAAEKLISGFPAR